MLCLTTACEPVQLTSSWQSVHNAAACRHQQCPAFRRVQHAQTCQAFSQTCAQLPAKYSTTIHTPAIRNMHQWEDRKAD
jgi:hypothetical protein